MAIKAKLITGDVEKDAILAKIQELSDMVAAYFSKFEKTTNGTQSVGDIGFKFVETCSATMPNYPEILAATFNQADAQVKMGGVFDFFTFKGLVATMILDWEKSARICKTDAMFYANKYYRTIQTEAETTAKYRPAYNELMPFYKKSASEPAPATKIKGDNAPSPTT